VCLICFLNISYKNLFALLDIICCIAVLLPIVSSIRTMRAEQANDDAQSIKGVYDLFALALSVFVV